MYEEKLRAAVDNATHELTPGHVTRIELINFTQHLESDGFMIVTKELMELAVRFADHTLNSPEFQNIQADKKREFSLDLVSTYSTIKSDLLDQIRTFKAVNMISTSLDLIHRSTSTNELKGNNGFVAPKTAAEAKRRNFLNVTGK